MRLVNKNKLLAPNKCLVCERVPNQRVVDTLFKNFNNTASDPMRGRKYVCERCGSKIAEALAYPPPVKVKEYQMKIETLQVQVDMLQKDAKAAELYSELKKYLEEQKSEIPLGD